MKFLGVFLGADGGVRAVHCADDDEEEQWARPLGALAPEEAEEAERVLPPTQWYLLTGELESLLASGACLARNQRRLLLQAFEAVKDGGDAGLARALQGCLAANIELADQLLLQLLVFLHVLRAESCKCCLLLLLQSRMQLIQLYCQLLGCLSSLCSSNLHTVLYSSSSSCGRGTSL